MTPMMPLMTGAPPTAEIARELFWNQGYKRKEREIEMALNIPK